MPIYDYPKNEALLSRGEEIFAEAVAVRASLARKYRPGNAHREAKLRLIYSQILAVKQQLKKELLRFAQVQPADCVEYERRMRALQENLNKERRKIYKLMYVTKTEREVEPPEFVTLTREEYDALRVG
jgi:hypothetical protein